jgi:hypothetical protein
MRERLERIRQGLGTREFAVCGAAPEWIIEQIEVRFEEMLVKLTPENEFTLVNEFVRGAARYISDQCGCECDTLGDALFALENNR